MYSVIIRHNLNDMILSVKTNLREVSKLGTTGRNLFGLLQYTSVDDHDVGEFCCEAELDLHPAVELQTKALWEHCGDALQSKFCTLLWINSKQKSKKGLPWATAHCRFRAEEDREQCSGVSIGSVRERRSERLLRSSRACRPRVISKRPMSTKR